MPDPVAGLIVQNAVCHEEGLGPLWPLGANFFSPEATRMRHVGKSPHPDRYDPDLWTDELAFLARPGQYDIQTDLFHDYQSNVAAYPAWQAWLRAQRPPMLVAWGRCDLSFEVTAAHAYARDVPDAEIHLLDAGHFALDEAADEIALLIRGFMQQRVG